MVVQSTLPRIDYTARDFESIKTALLDYLKQRFPDDFADFSESQLGIALLEMMAYVGDILSFMLDRVANEVYIETAQERRSVIKLAALLGYKLSSATAASVDLLLSDLDQYSGTLIIDKGVQLSGGNLLYEISETFTLTRAGTTTPSQWSVNGATATTVPIVAAVQGETISETFTANGGKFQLFILTKSPIIGDSSVVTVNAVSFTSVDSLILGNPLDSNDQNIYEVIKDENDKATIRFGDGVSGNIPTLGASIAVTYRVGGGSAGNVSALAIGTTIPADNGGSPVQLNVSNPNAAAGGADRESLEHARFFAPQSAKTNDRAVTFNDYFVLSNGFTDGTSGTIAKAGILSPTSDGISNQVTVYTWVQDQAGTLSTTVPLALRNALQSLLNDRKITTVNVNVQEGVNIPVDISLLIRKDVASSISSIQTNVRNALEAIFKEPRVRFGNELRMSWIIDRIQDLEGVFNLHIQVPSPLIEPGTALELEGGGPASLPNQAAAGPDQVVLPNSSSSTDDFYCNYRIEITGGIGAGQTERIISYVGSTKVATIERNWAQRPSEFASYRIIHPRRIRLAETANSTPDFYNNQVLILDSGAAAGQTRFILDYLIDAQLGKIAIVNQDWQVFPDSLTTYQITPDIKVSENQAIILGSDIQITVL